MESEGIGHHCGVALIRLLKPVEYFVEKYGTVFYGLKNLYLLMEKQRNRGQDGAGIACVKLDLEPGFPFIDCQRSIAQDPIKDVMYKCEKLASEKLQELDGGLRRNGRILKHRVPFTGEVFLGHVRYGTDSDNSEDRCHPIPHENNWMTRNLVLAGNFNLTNVDELFSELVELGQHPREKSDTITLLENISHFLDKENNDLYVKYFAAGHGMQDCFRLIADNINVPRILRQAAAHWDGGYVIGGLLGHGDAFALRDPSGIRPAFYYVDEEVAVVASERPVIQSVFGCGVDEVREIGPGNALVIKRDGTVFQERVIDPLPYRGCTFERIYFSRGGDAAIYRERERLGRNLVPEVLQALDGDLENAVFGFIPNTSELSYYGLVKGMEEQMDRIKEEKILALGPAPDPAEVRKILALKVRVEKVAFKDAKIRTFIQEDKSREFLVSHAYDVTYDSVKPTDALVVIDDSVVRGTTLTNSILKNLDRLRPRKIVVVSSAPQIRYPDCYGIDIAKIDNLIAFKAATALCKERGMEARLREVYEKCKIQQQLMVASADPDLFINHVKAVFEPFTYQEVSDKVAQLVRPKEFQSEIKVVYQTIEGLHKAMPDYKGDWYFTGDYPTPGGMKVVGRAFINYYEGRNERAYGVISSNLGKTCLVIGSGGREHTFAWKLAQSKQVGAVWVAPGNGGTQDVQVGRVTIKNVKLDLSPTKGFQDVIDFCSANGVDLVAVGPEQPLVDGIVDALHAAGIKVFGPSKAAALLEGSKAFCKDFMAKYSVPTAEFKSFKGVGELDAAIKYINESPFDVVVKASGLAAGKGVVVPETKEEAIAALKECLEGRVFGEAGDEVVIEEKLEGPEVSVFGLSDGYTVLPLLPAQDHKRAYDDDKGPNTGGMGAFCPTPLVCEDLLKEITDKVLQPTVDGMRKEGTPFVGCLYAGLMLTKNGPKNLEFNVRFGDPETQVVLPLLKTDLYDLMCACAEQRLSSINVEFHTGAACTVVMASGGYPGSYHKGYEITGLKNAMSVPGVTVFHAGTKIRPISPNKGNPALGQRTVETSGGRVLAVTAVARSLPEAQTRAYVGMRCINFIGGFYRKDIGKKLLRLPTEDFTTMQSDPLKKQSVESIFSMSSPTHHGDVSGGTGLTYLAAGVDKAAGDAAKDGIQPYVRRTSRSGCMASSEDTSGMCDLLTAGHRDAVLVTGTAGVGTKLKVAADVEKYDTLGTDLVALCVNDVVSHGAEPIFFTDYYATGKQRVAQTVAIVKGMGEGCIQAGCSLFPGEKAELPGIFPRGEFDMAGFAVGAADRSTVLPKKDAMQEGDVLIGLASSGIHANGFSLVRRVIASQGLSYNAPAPFDASRSLGDVFLTPTRIYVKAVMPLCNGGMLKGAAHIAAGGLLESVAKILPVNLMARIDTTAWELPAVFRWLLEVGRIEPRELARTFNCGVGMVLVVAQGDETAVMQELSNHGEEPFVIGQLAVNDASRKSSSEMSQSMTKPTRSRVKLDNIEASWLKTTRFTSLTADDFQNTRKVRTAVLISGTGTNLQALIDCCRLPTFPAEVSLVVSNVPGVGGLERAAAAKVPHMTLNHKEFPDRSSFEGALHDILVRNNIQLICLAGFMRILTDEFVCKWPNKIINIHPSLLPAFPGLNCHRRVLEKGVKVTGCTVHYVTAGDHVDCGPIIIQEAIPVEDDDTPESLTERVKVHCEWKAYPRALALVAEGKAPIVDGKVKIEAY
ncbi:unnamed protein product [Vitrella brassicaformis CCMP3155]|uniref:Phosphoribosylformylglycinamidine cyclo-ligase n=3 Tax=Vitrella brassicaformis TaxID=1169539 RepID=A0A0G4G1V3_VITBC|nr:unnamed protein product [Vitrella brassicaformis CCMP3155]|eukprot:CEM21717.1 unnamed protein product [Vitrella brassicaformis CCMP3155]